MEKNFCNLALFLDKRPICRKIYRFLKLLILFSFRARPDGNCLYNAISIALYENDSWANHLRLLTSIELFSNCQFYLKHPVFGSAFNLQKTNKNVTERPPMTFFRMSLKNSTIDKCNNDKDYVENAVKFEAISKCRNNEWSSFMCILGLSSVIKQNIQSIFPDRGAYMDRLLKNQKITPRGESSTINEIFLLFCQTSRINMLTQAGEAFKANHFVPLVQAYKDNGIFLKRQLLQKLSTNKQILKRPKLDSSILGGSKKMSQSKIMFGKKALLVNTDKNETKTSSTKTKKEDTEAIPRSSNLQNTSNSAEDNTESSSAFPDKQTCNDLLKDKLDVSTFKDICLSGISNFEKHTLIKQVFVPDKNYKFEKPLGSNRKFVYNWLSQYRWLYFSHKNQGAYCLPCVMFSGKDIEKAKNLITQPFTNYKNATTYFKKHEESRESNHAKSMFAYNMFLKEMAGKVVPVSATLTSKSKHDKEDSRHILLSIIDGILLCAQLSLPFRGNKDSLKHQSDPGLGLINLGIGNFIPILQFSARQGNALLERHLKKASKRAKYTFAPTQNLFLQCAYEIMTEKIVSEIKESKYFTILADEAADSSNLEQMAFCIRFIDKKCEIREEFLQFVDCSNDVSAEGLYKSIKNALSTLNLDIANCRGQGYDGASTISGSVNGVDARIRGDCNKAVYTHCFNHRLNLAVSSTYSILSVRNTMDTIREISDLFRNSPGRENKFKEFFEQFPHLNYKKLMNVCLTRWLERIVAFDRFHEFYVIIFNTHNFMSESKVINVNTRSRASQLLKKMMDFEFIFAMIMLKHIFGYTKQTTQLMQKKSQLILRIELNFRN